MLPWIPIAGDQRRSLPRVAQRSRERWSFLTSLRPPTHEETELVANVVGFSDRSSGWLQPWSSWKKSSWAAWSDVQHRKLVSKDSVSTKVELYSSADWNHTDFCWNQWIVFFFLFRLSLCPTGHEHSPEQGWLTRKSLSWHDTCLIIERWACLSKRKFMNRGW